MKRLLLFTFMGAFFMLGTSAVFAQTSNQPPLSQSVIEPGKKIKIDDNYSYVFEFAERPK
ncbi:MAG: hypothetical protein LBD73_00725 [Deferribacteraceae bacterium]|jgi:hypothetical protein|nr:hypothetical protein [Deferribacteraceae bacterium]